MSEDFNRGFQAARNHDRKIVEEYLLGVKQGPREDGDYEIIDILESILSSMPLESK